MKKLLLLSFLTIAALSTSSYAQTDAKAKAILDKLSKKMSSLKSMKANFSLSLVNASGKTMQTKKGNFFLKGDKYRITLGDQDIICDGKTIWTYIKATNEVQVTNYNAAEQTISPAKLFTNFYDDEYNYNYAGASTFAGKTCYLIEMTPKSSNKQFKKLKLAIDQTDVVAGGDVYEKNGNQYHYEVKNFSPNASIDNTMFSFDTKKYPNVEVVDLR